MHIHDPDIDAIRTAGTDNPQPGVNFGGLDG